MVVSSSSHVMTPARNCRRNRTRGSLLHSTYHRIRSGPKEAADVAFYALNYSFEHKKPVIIRSTHRVSHAREAIPLSRPPDKKGVS